MFPPSPLPYTSSDPVIVDAFFSRGHKFSSVLAATVLGNDPSDQRDVDIPPEFIGSEIGDVVGAWVRFPMARNQCCGPIEIIRPAPLPTAIVKGIPMIQVPCKAVGNADGYWLLENRQIGAVIDHSRVFARYGVKAVLGSTYDLWLIRWCQVLSNGELVWWRVGAYQGQDFGPMPSFSSEHSSTRQPAAPSSAQSSSFEPARPFSFASPAASLSHARTRMTPSPPTPPSQTAPVIQSPDLIPSMSTIYRTGPTPPTSIDRSTAKLLQDPDIDHQMSVLLRRVMCNRDMRRAIEKADKALYEEIIDRLV